MAAVHERCPRCGKARALLPCVDGGAFLRVCAGCKRQLEELGKKPAKEVRK
jgi:hypothetical protein